MDTIAKLFTDPFVVGLVFVASVAMFVSGVVGVPLLIARLPADYFVRPRRRVADTQHPLLRALRNTVQNLLGGFLLFAGIAMLFLPGQGVLTILVAVSLLEFPGKRRLQRRLLALPGVQRVVQAIRHRAGVPPLQLERHPHHEPEREVDDASA
jgi:hypothetical protein